jgi:hypothetical protein
LEIGKALREIGALFVLGKRERFNSEFAEEEHRDHREANSKSTAKSGCATPPGGDRVL